MAGIIELARFGLELMIRNNCLLIMENGISRSVTPLREISAVLITNPAVSLSGYVLTALAERHIPLICSRKRDACDSFFCRIPHTNATSLLKMEKNRKSKPTRPVDNLFLMIYNSLPVKTSGFSNR